MESVKNFMDGIRIFIKEHLDNAPFDKTDIGIIKGVSEFGYIVKYNGKLYDNIRTIGGSCNINETVDIMIPLNNLNNMFILKSVDDSFINIPRNTDMKSFDYFEIGNYKCVGNNIAITLVNCPVNIAFTMKCYYSVGTFNNSEYDYRIQEYTAFDGSYKVLVFARFNNKILAEYKVYKYNGILIQ